MGRLLGVIALVCLWTASARADTLKAATGNVIQQAHRVIIEKNLDVLERVEAIATARGVTPSVLALAWVLAQNAVPIFGTKRRSYLEENVAAASVELNADDLAAIDAASPRGAAAGDRYPDMRHVNR